ncbi:MAG: hypothetical protein MUF58_20040 [Arcicella sp.]|jgi:hypothetical protein|nr:hypothetical protein [Arcicella sp.]
MMDYQRLSNLSQKIQNGAATKSEKDDYMWMIYQNGSISKSQYDNYKNNQNVSDVLNAGLTIGAIILLGALLKKVVNV